MADVTELINRVRAATGPDRELDEAIALVTCNGHFFAQLADAPNGVGCEMYRIGLHPFSSALRVTASIDAITALIEQKLPGWHVSSGTVGDHHDQPWACLTSPDNPHPDFPAYHVTEALARTEAFLLALQSQDTDHDQ